MSLEKIVLVPVCIFLCLLKILQNIKAFVNIKVFWCIFTYINTINMQYYCTHSGQICYYNTQISQTSYSPINHFLSYNTTYTTWQSKWNMSYFSDTLGSVRHCTYWASVIKLWMFVYIHKCCFWYFVAFDSTCNLCKNDFKNINPTSV